MADYCFVAIVGSRGPKDDVDWHSQVRNMVFQLVSMLPHRAVIISGGARGVDTYAIDAAKTYYFNYFEIPAIWSVDGKFDSQAGYRRNPIIVNRADLIVSFHDGNSRGSLHTMDEAARQGKPLFRVSIPQDASFPDSLQNIVDAVRGVLDE